MQISSRGSKGTRSKNHGTFAEAIRPYQLHSSQFFLLVDTLKIEKTQFYRAGFIQRSFVFTYRCFKNKKERNSVLPCRLDPAQFVFTCRYFKNKKEIDPVLPCRLHPSQIHLLHNSLFKREQLNLVI